MSFINKFLFLICFVGLVSCDAYDDHDGDGPGDRFRNKSKVSVDIFNLKLFKILIDEYKEAVKTLRAERAYSNAQHLLYEMNKIHNEIMEKQELGFKLFDKLKIKLENLEFMLLTSGDPIPDSVYDQLDLIWMELEMIDGLISEKYEEHDNDEPAPYMNDKMECEWDSCYIDNYEMEGSEAAEEPAVESLTVDSGLIEEPVVESLVVDSEVIEEPVVENSAVDSEAAEEPVVENSAVDSEVTEEPVAENSAVDSEVTEEPVAENVDSSVEAAEEPVVENSAVDSEAIEEPVAESSAVDSEVTEEPVAESSAVDSEVTEEPVAESSAVDSEVIEEPVADNSAVDSEVTEEPVAENSEVVQN